MSNIWKSESALQYLLKSCQVLNTMFTVKFQGTGSVFLDMEKQLQANIIRIKVLGQENTSLHSAIEKLRQSAQRNASEVGLACMCAVFVVWVLIEMHFFLVDLFELQAGQLFFVAFHHTSYVLAIAIAGPISNMTLSHCMLLLYHSWWFQSYWGKTYCC